MSKCHGLTPKGTKCVRKALKNGYCRAHQDQFQPENLPELLEKPAEIVSKTEIQTTTLMTETAVLRYRMNPLCPKCNGNSMCMTRRGGYASHRCRQCGHRWEEGAV